MSQDHDALKLFAMTSQLIEHDLDQVEREHAIDLQRGHRAVAEVDAEYYPQIESAIRAEAARMAPHYEVLYSLEKTIRGGVADQLETADSEWWTTRVPPQLRKEAEQRQKREVDTGVTPRSDDLIDYLTLGQLSGVISANWDVFGAIFSSQKAVERVMSSLNTVRAPVAHCSPLAEDEVVRLRLTVRDWFRVEE